MGLTIDLSVLLVFAVLGSAIESLFEIEIPLWRRILKWGLVIGVTLALETVIGHWALIVPVPAASVGLIAHHAWCKRHGIDPAHATPGRRYYRASSVPVPLPTDSGRLGEGLPTSFRPGVEAPHGAPPFRL